MALDFPSSPTNNQVYENYIYNSTSGAWQKLPGNTFADAAISDTPPVNPNDGDLWWSNDLTTGNKLSVYNGSSFVNTAPISNNAIINGDFGIWQRGTSFSGSAFTADRWLSNDSGASITTSRQSFTPADIEAIGYGDAEYFARVVATVSDSGWGLIQRVENVRTFASQTVTASFWAKADSARTFRVGVYQGFGSGGSTLVTAFTSDVSVTTSWQRFTVTGTVPSVSGKTIGTDSWLNLQVLNPNAETGTLDVWGMQLEAGPVATPFRLAGRGSKGAELALCQRYYEKSYNVDVVPGTSTTDGVHQEVGGSDSAANTASAVSFAVSKRIAPTITLYSSTGVQGDWRYFRNGASGETTASAPFVGETRMRVDVASVGASWAVVGVRGHFVADAEL